MDRGIQKCCLVIAFVAFMLSMIPSLSTGDTIVVDDDSGSWADYTSIEDAVENAAEGDEILVYNGSYEGTTIDVTVSITGNGSSTTSVHGNSLYVQAQWVNISGFSFYPDFYGCSFSSSAEYSTIYNCSFNNVPRSGVLISSDHITVQDCTFSNVSRAGIDLSSNRFAVINNCSMNSGGIGVAPSNMNGTMITHNIDNVTVLGRDVYFLKNSTGGSIPINSAQVILVNCSTITSSSLTLSNIHTGIVIVRSADISFSNTIMNNTYYGAILWGLNHSSFENLIIENSYWGLFLYSGENLSLDDVSVLNCTNSGMYGSYLRTTDIQDLQVNNTDGITLRWGKEFSANGFSSNHSKQYGIQMESINDIKLTSIYTCNNSEKGLLLDDCQEIEISDVYSNNNGETGVHLSGSTNVTVYRGEISYNTNVQAFKAYGLIGSSTAIDSLKIHHNSYVGLGVWLSVNNTRSYNNGEAGITASTITNSSAYGNKVRGIRGASYIENTYVFDNEGSGIEPTTLGCRITSSQVYNNTEHGIIAKTNSNIDNCTVYNNSEDGIKIDANYVTVDNVTLYGNDQGVNCRLNDYNITYSNISSNRIGVYLQRGGTITDTVIANNSEYGVYSFTWGNSILNNVQISDSNAFYSPTASSISKLLNCFIDGWFNITNTEAYFLNTTYIDVSINSDATLMVDNYLHIHVELDSGAPISGGDIEVVNGTKAIYQTSWYDGDDAQTDEHGNVSWIRVTDKYYGGSSTPEDFETDINVRYRTWEDSREVNMSSSHTEIFISNWTEIFVDDDNKGDPDMNGSLEHPYDEIQKALDNSTDGDFVRVFEGYYRERIEVTTQVRIIGNGSDNTTIDGYGSRAVWIKHDNVTVCKFHLNGSHSVGQAMLVDSNYITIFKNHFEGNSDGISVWGDHNSTIFNNYFTNNRGNGIDLSGSINITVRDNLFMDNPGRSIMLGSTSAYCKIINNTALDNDIGSIRIQGKYHLSKDNYFNNSGSLILIGDWLTAINNTCLNNSGRGIQVNGDNNTIRNNICMYNNEEGGLWEGIYAWGWNNEITDNICKYNGYGIRLYAAGRNNVSGNDLTNNDYSGIRMGSWVYKNFVSDNNCSFNQVNGIYLEDEQQDKTEKNTIEQNLCLNNGENGIAIEFITKRNSFLNNDCGFNINGINSSDASNLIIESNNCDNNKYGIYIYNSEYNEVIDNSVRNNSNSGVYAWGSQNCNITGTSAYDNSMNGIEIFASNHSEILDNYFLGNTEVGVKISDSNNNSILDNTILDLTPTSSVGLVIEQDSSYITASGNSIQQCWQGVTLSVIEKIWFNNNTIMYNENGISLSSSDENQIDNNDFSNNEEIGFSINKSNKNLIHNNSISNNEYGLVLGDDLSGNVFEFNSISANMLYGAWEDNISTPVDLTLNWWGDRTGPYHTSKNSKGSGDAVSDNITFDPWLPHAEIITINPNPANQGESVTFKGRGLSLGVTERYSWWSDLDGELYNGTNKSFIASPSNGTHNITFKVLTTVGGWSKGTQAVLIINGIPRAEILSINPINSTEGEIVEMIGKGSDDGSITQYRWGSDIDGIIYQGSNASVNITDLSNGTHVITLRVKDDGDDWSEEDTMNTKVNGIPVARIDPLTPSFTLEGETIKFIGKGIDDKAILRYRWNSSIDGLLFNSTADQFNITSLVNGTHTITLEVQDAEGVWSIPKSFNLMVNGIPRSVIDSIDPNFARLGDNVTFLASGEDDGTITTYQWRSSFDGLLYDGPNSSFSTDILRNGSHIISVRVQDNDGTWSDYSNATYLVSEIPIAELISVTPNWSVEGSLVTFVGKGIDDNNISIYSWASNLDGKLYNGSSSSFNKSQLSNGTHEISLLVIDEVGLWSNWVNTSIEVNGRPRAKILSVTPAIAIPRDQVSFKGSGTDDGNITRYVWYSSLDKVLANSTKSTFSKSGLSQGTHYISLTVFDDHGTSSDNATFSLVINKIPTVTITAPLNFSKVSKVVTIGGTAEDSDGTIVSVEISINNGPWIKVDGTAQWVYAWDTRELQDAQYEIRVRAKDTSHYSNIKSIRLFVEAEDKANGDDEGGISGMLIGIIVGLVIAFAILGMLFIKNQTQGKTEDK